jgi:hypothetical protein
VTSDWRPVTGGNSIANRWSLLTPRYFPVEFIAFSFSRIAGAFQSIERGITMQQSSTAVHDGNPAHSATLTATFTVDAQDPSDHLTAASVASAFNGRKGSATISITNPDPATVLIQVTI